MKPTLLVLAAGMGSRYGSLKQMDGIGPNNEAIIDYSIYDAIRAGFGKVVFVIRHEFENEFREVFSPVRFGNNIEVEFAFQELDRLPEGFTLPAGRVKPWGTNHAILVAKDNIDTPFAVINADDFYGKDAYQTIARHLSTLQQSENDYCMVAYDLANTLSEYGSVSRGVCSIDAEDHLVSMVERTSIKPENGSIFFEDTEGKHPLAGDTPVSMNLFGFTPDYFTHSERYFTEFLRDNINNEKSEFYIPSMVNHLISSGIAQMRVLRTDSSWFGVTYKEDKPSVVGKINALIAQGEYPSRLWK